MDHFLLFIKEIFDIGNSSGSLLFEALGLFKTFQKISSTKTFSAHFSNECYEMFSWALNIIEIIKRAFYFRPLSDYEIFYIYNLVIPMAIMTYIITMRCTYDVIFYIIIHGFFLMVGAGFGYIGFQKSIVIGLLVTALVIVVIFVVSYFFFEDFFLKISTLIIYFFEEEGEMSESNWIIFSFPFSIAVLVASILLTPIFKKSSQLTKIYSIVMIVIILLVLIIETVIILLRKFFAKSESDYRFKALSLGLTCFQLLIVPATKYFMVVISDVYKYDWRCFCAYIVFSIILPISLTVVLILAKVQIMIHKYKNHWYAFAEVVEIVRQVIYAILAALDIPWACIGIEIAWIILVFAFRPYIQVSEYVIQCGNSLVIIAETAVCLAADHNGTEFLTFNVSIALVVVACIPAILALYIFFIFDFGYKPEDKTNNELVTYMATAVKFASPIAWMIYGLGIPLIELSTKPQYL